MASVGPLPRRPGAAGTPAWRPRCRRLLIAAAAVALAVADLAFTLPRSRRPWPRLVAARFGAERDSSPRARMACRALAPVQSWLESQGYQVQADKNQGGSSWSSFRIIKTDKGDLFVKTSRRPASVMFEGEALGLQALGAAAGVRVPKVLHFGDDGSGGSFIIMEKLDMGGSPNMREFGRAMARMHLAEPAAPEAKAGKFGFALDNTIGATPQPNPWTDDWPEFFREQRLGFQVKRAGSTGLTNTWKQVVDATDGLKDLFTDGEVRPSVLHGDLWSGNYANSPDGAAIFDPATYYGHHEAEWGMSWCAGFNRDFWAGYREVLPEAPLFRRRQPLYEAYHIINHYNLFGGGYLEQGKALLERLL